MATNLKKRIVYIDALRGFTILLVIYSHLIFLYMKGSGAVSELNNVFIIFRMPLFFFISGFFVFSNNYDRILFKTKIKKRFISQLYPTAILFVLFIAIFSDCNFKAALLSDTKSGYWFTLSSLEFFILSFPILVAQIWIKRLRLLWQNLIFFFYWLTIAFIFRIIRDNAGDISSLFGLNYIVRYYVYFVGGMLLKMNLKYLRKIIANRYVAMSCVCCFFAVYLGIEWRKYLFPFYVMGFSAIIALFHIFATLFNSERIIQSHVSKWIQYLGTMTLEIYLLHFYVFTLLRNHVGYEWLTFHVNKPWEFVVVITLSAGIALICLSIVNLLKKIRVYRFIFPSLKR